MAKVSQKQISYDLSSVVLKTKQFPLQQLEEEANIIVHSGL